MRHGEHLAPSPVFSHKKRNTLDLEVGKTDPNGIALANEGINEILKSPNFEVLEQAETKSKAKLRQSSRSSSHSPKHGDDDDVWEPAEKDAPFFKPGGQALPSATEAKQVIETTC